MNKVPDNGLLYHIYIIHRPTKQVTSRDQIPPSLQRLHTWHVCVFIKLMHGLMVIRNRFQSLQKHFKSQEAPDVCLRFEHSLMIYYFLSHEFRSP